MNQADSLPEEPERADGVEVGRVSTPGRMLFAFAPSIAMLLTPLLPFATKPTLWFGIPAVLVWTAVMVVLTVMFLQIVDRGINRQESAAVRAWAADRGKELA